MSATWMRAHELGQPLRLMVIGWSNVGSRVLELADQRASRAPWSRRSRACRTRCRCTPWCRGGTSRRAHRAGRAPRAPSTSASTLSGGDVEHDDLLLDGQPDPVRRRPPRRGRRPAASSVAGDAADRGRDADVEAAVDLRVHADVVATAGRRRGRPGPSASVQPRYSSSSTCAEQLGTPVGHEELQARAGAQPAVAVVAEDADDARPDVGDLARA